MKPLHLNSATRFSLEVGMVTIRSATICFAACFATACGEGGPTNLLIDVQGRPDAVVYLDDSSFAWPAIGIAGLPPGEHNVTVAYGDKTFVRRVTLEEGTVESISIVAKEDDVLDLERIRDAWRERLVDARYGDDEARAGFGKDLLDWKNEGFVDVVFEGIDASLDQWLIPILVEGVTGRGYGFWRRAEAALWANFPTQASLITEEKIDEVNAWRAHELAMHASRAGHLTDRTKRVLDADCAKQTGKLWGFYMLPGRSDATGTTIDLAYACPNSPGARTPLLPGDSILSVDGVRLYGQSVIQTFRAKDHFTVRIARHGVELDFELSR